MSAPSVVHLSHTDARAGAGRAAYRIHRSLVDIGIRSTMIVGDKRTDDQSVHPTSRGVLSKFRRKIGEYTEAKLSRSIVSDSAGFFSPALSGHYRPDKDREFVSADIACLYWVNGALITPETLGRLKKPLIWRLSDTWPFTGGCHYPGSCIRFRDRCGGCPQLAHRGRSDRSARLWLRKKQAWDKLNLTIVAPSRWMADLARSSSLFARHRIEVIPTGVDLSIFQPEKKLKARKQLGLPEDKQLLLFGAMSDRLDPRKGFQQLNEALERLALGPHSGQIIAVTFGSSGEEETELPIPTVSLGRIDDDHKLCKVYSAADMVVVPSSEDNLPNVALEAIACGTPVVAFEVGGMSDIVLSGKTGALAQPLDSASLAHELEILLSDETRLTEMAHEARRHAEATFSIQQQAKSYVALFEELTGKVFRASEPVTS